MSKKLLGLCTVVLLVAGLLVAAAVPALAQRPFSVTNFHPNDTMEGLVGHTDFGDVLSDRFDGTDTAAHLTTVATPETDRVSWFVCPAGTVAADNDNAVTQAELAACVRIAGDDTTGTRPAGGSAVAPTDEAYDSTWNIPPDLDRQIRDIIALACIGAGDRVEDQPGQPANCRVAAENDISLDDGQTFATGSDADTQTNAGEIVSYCTQDVVGGPEQSENNFVNDPCEVDPGPAGGTTAVAGTQARADVDARFVPFPHGSPIPNDGFVARVTTDLSIEPGGLTAWLIGPADATSKQNNLGLNPTFCTVILTGAESRTWECAVTAANVPDDTELDFLILDEFDDAGAGFCDTADPGSPHDPDGADQPFCQMDAHYVVSAARGPNVAQASFQPNPTTGSPDTNAGTPACDPGDVQDKIEDNDVSTGGNPETVVGCLLDQFGNTMNNRPVTFESTTTPQGAGITSCNPGETGGAAGVLHDHNNDGRNDHCHTTTDADGEARAVINNFSTGTNIIARPGDQTVTFCDDPQFNPGVTAANQPTGHGCADAPANAKDTVVKRWISRPAHIHLVFAGTGTAADPCHTGETFRENVIGDFDDVLACTFDNADNPANTVQSPGGRLQWFIYPSGGGEVTATRFASIPPSETGTDARAIARIESFRQGNDIIEVHLVTENAQGVSNCNPVPGGGNCPFDIIQKRVTQVTQPTATGSPQTPTGTASPTTTVSPTTTGGPAARTVSLEASKNRKTFGREITFTATVSGTEPLSPAACIAGVEVVLSRTVLGTTQVVQMATGTTDAEGAVSFNRSADQSATWVASVAATPACGAATSDGTTVLVRKAVTLKFQPSSNVRRGTRVTMNVTVAPCAGHEGDRVTLWKAIGGVMSKVGDKRSTSNCSATFRRTIRRDSVFQARSPKSDPDHIGGKSRRKGINVGRQRGRN